MSREIINKMLLSVRHRRSTIAIVYDGRTWPVVRCGSVYVTSDDTAHQVTNNILSATCLAEKKKRAHKFTVAIGTTHGHVQSFLADTDNVLSALDGCHVDEKCLMLIKRPKHSAKQMLKAHSWANLSVSDTHLNRPLDGSGFNSSKFSPFKWRRGTDQKSAMSETGSVQDVRDGFNKENVRKINNRPSPRAVVPPMVNGTNSLDRQPISRPDFNQSKNSEINNNKLSNNRDVYMYHSCLDISTMPTVHETEVEQPRRHDDHRSSEQTQEEVDVSRAHSLGDLTKGLSFSVPSSADRKSGSMMNLSNVAPPRAKRRTRAPGTNNERYNTLEVFQEIPEHYSQKLNLSSSSDYNYSAVCSPRSESANTPREKSPLKQKRSLPHVPTVEANERIKRFTEMMKSRMAGQSRNSYRTNSQNSYYSDGKNMSYNGETPSDSEVSELTSPVKSSPQSFKTLTCNNTTPRKPRDPRDSGKNISYNEKFVSNNHSSYGKIQSPPTVPSGDRINDSGQITLSSHCSTVDSGYTTNNDGDYEFGHTPRNHRVPQNSHNPHPSYTLPRNSYADYATVKSPHRQPYLNGNQRSPEKPKPTTAPKPLRINTLPSHHRGVDTKYSNNPHQRRSWDPANSLDNLHQDHNQVTNSAQFHPAVMNGYHLPNHISDIKDNITKPGFVSSTLPGRWKNPNSPEVRQITPPLGSPNSKPPTMFQLTMNYSFHPVKISLPSVSLLMDSIELKDALVELPECRDTPENSPSSLPQGRYAKLGGPGSAFRPVRPASITPGVGKMVAIEKLTKDILRACVIGELKEGDILIEINGQPLLGADIKNVKKNFELCQGDINFTVARVKLPIQNQNKQTSYDLLSNKLIELEHEMKKLKVEVKNKDSKIKQLTAILPPRRNSSPISDVGLPNFDNIVISEDEFIV